jgi:nucleotide-binding universal stress UspA family protein
METAVATAKIDGGHILGLHARIDAIETAAMIDVTFPQRHDQLGLAVTKISQEEFTRSQHARAAFEDACRRHQVAQESKPGEAKTVSAAWKETRSFFNETLDEARYHDLVVIGRAQELSADRIKTVLMQCGRPLLVAPSMPTAAMGRHIAIAWKAGAEAARAVTAASWLLAQAEQVSIVSVSENQPFDEQDRVSTDRLATELRWRGVKADVQMEYSQSASTSGAIKNLAYARDADLLIMGAYGHNRLREYVLGGVTEDMLRRDCAIPVFMFR